MENSTKFQVEINLEPPPCYVTQLSLESLIGPISSVKEISKVPRYTYSVFTDDKTPLQIVF